MTDPAERSNRRPIHAVHAVLLSSILPLFLGALLSDWAYSTTYEIQWTNFASWLIAGGLLFGGLALLWALIDLLRRDSAGGRGPLIYFIVLLVTWSVGLLNALVHAKDAWAVMPEGLILSIVVAVLAVAAVWLGFSTSRTGADR